MSKSFEDLMADLDGDDDVAEAAPAAAVAAPAVMEINVAADDPEIMSLPGSEDTTGQPPATPKREKHTAMADALDWIRGLMPENMGEKLDPNAGGDGATDLGGGMAFAGSEAMPYLQGAAPGSSLKTLKGLTAGTANGLSMGLAKAGTRFVEEDRDETKLGLPVDNAYLEWDAEAQRDSPVAYAVADGVTSALHPVNKLLAPFRAAQKGESLLTGVGKVFGNAATEGAYGALDSGIREYGDTGSASPGHAKTAGWISGLTSMVGNAFGHGIERFGARTGTDSVLELRDLAQREARLRSVGMSDADIAVLKQTPEKFVATSDEANRLAEGFSEGEGKQFMGAYTPREMYQRARDAANQSAAGKDALANEVAARNGSVRPAEVANDLRQMASEKFSIGAPNSSGKIETLEDLAGKYEAWPSKLHDGLGEEVFVPPRGPATAAPFEELPPPPLSAGPMDAAPAPPPTRADLAAAAFENPEAVAGMPGAQSVRNAVGGPPAPRPSARYQDPEIQEADLMPVRPSARAAPQPGLPPVDPRDQLVADIETAHSRIPQEPDPIGALAEQGMPPERWGQEMEDEMIAGGLNRGDIDPAELVEAEALAGPMTGAPVPPAPARPPSARYVEQVEEMNPLDVQRIRPSARAPQPTPPTAAAQGLPPPPLPAGPPPLPGAAPTPAAGPSPIDQYHQDLSMGRDPGAYPVPPSAEAQAATGLPPQGTPDAAASALAAAGAAPPAGPPGPMLGPPNPQYGPPELLRREIPGIPLDEVPFMEANKERQLLGAGIPAGTPPTPGNEFLRAQYAALDDAQQAGANRVDAGLGDQWAALKAAEGKQRTIAEAGYNDPTSTERLLDYRDRVLAGLGSGAAGYFAGGGPGGEDSGTLGALGGAAGFLGSRFARQRGDALQANWLARDTAEMARNLGTKISQAPTGSLAASVVDDTQRAPTTTLDDNQQTGYPPGTVLGRNTTAAMRANPDLFMPWAEVFNKKRSDDDRAAAVELLTRTDPNFERVKRFIDSQNPDLQR